MQARRVDAGLAFGAASSARYDRFVTADAIVPALAGSAGMLIPAVMGASLHVELRTVREGRRRTA